MTRRHHRLVGRAHRRAAQGVPLTSSAARAALLLDRHPGMWDAFQALVERFRAAWDEIRTTVSSALAGTSAGFALGSQLPPPPVRRRPGGPLIHNGRKPR